MMLVGLYGVQTDCEDPCDRRGMTNKDPKKKQERLTLIHTNSSTTFNREIFEKENGVSFFLLFRG